MRILVLAAALLAGLSSAEAAPLALHRGVGLHEWLNWSPLATDGSYRWPPYRSVEEWLTQYRPLGDWPAGDPFGQIKELGFDFVRLTVDPGPLLASSGTRRDEALRLLSDDVRAVTAAGLRVVFNLHAVSQVKATSMDVVNGGEKSPGIADYRAMVADVAAMLAPLGTDKVALEPFNEPAYYPCDQSGSEDWQHIMAAQVAAIRAVSTGLTIVATGACGGSITGLTDIDPRPFDDPDILYSFHMYEPHAFTHQRDDNGGWWSGFPWPSGARDRGEVLADLRARMEAGGALPTEVTATLLNLGGELDDYIAGQWDAARLDARLDEAAQWADANGIPTSRLFMGEFGAMLLAADGKSGAEDADRLRYLSAVRQSAERYGIAWSIWEYSNPFGMTLIEPTGPAVADAALLQALGM